MPQIGTRPVRRWRPLCVLVFSCAAALIAGCGGGSVSAPATASGAPATAAAASQVAVLPTAAGTLVLGSAGGYTAAFAVLAGAPAGIAVSSTVATAAPAGAPVVLSARRAQAATAAIVPFLTLTASFSVDVPSGIVAAEVLSTSAAFANTFEYFVQVNDLTAGSSGLALTAGPLAANGSGSLVFGNGAPAPGFAATHSYLFQFYTLAAPAPSPSASAAATASPSAAPTASPSSSPSPAVSASPTAAPSPLGTYTFSGPTVTGATVAPPASPAPITVPASGTYGTYGVSVNVAFGSASTTAPFALTVALGSRTQNDISPPAAYPFYAGSAATPLFYLQVTSSAAVTFPKTPAITVSANSYAGSNTCSLYLYVNGGSGYAWTLVPGATGTISGNTVAIPAAAPPAGASESFSSGGSTPAFVGC